MTDPSTVCGFWDVWCRMDAHPGQAGWVQAVGSIAAVAGAAWIAARQSREALARDKRERRERRVAEAAAVLNSRKMAMAVITAIPQRLPTIVEVLRDPAAPSDPTLRGAALGMIEALIAQINAFPITALEDPSAVAPFSHFHALVSAARRRVMALEDRLGGMADDAVRAVALTHEADLLEAGIGDMRQIVQSLKAHWSAHFPTQAASEIGDDAEEPGVEGPTSLPGFTKSVV